MEERDYIIQLVLNLRVLNVLSVRVRMATIIRDVYIIKPMLRQTLAQNVELFTGIRKLVQKQINALSVEQAKASTLRTVHIIKR